MGGGLMLYDDSFLEDAHKFCESNSPENVAANSWACFFCYKRSASGELASQVEGAGGDGEVVICCPGCGIDSVLFSSSKLPIEDDEFLCAMRQKWFSSWASIIDTADSVIV